jgi:ABC-type phosphate transport system substrate-binding protein
MQTMRTKLSLITLLVCAFGFGSTVRAQDKVIKVDGSSTVFPISEAMAE